ncbi:MAG: hypothetical protein JXR07_20190 [Reichenbachiella sp.]
MNHTRRIVTALVLSCILLLVIFSEFYWPRIFRFGSLLSVILILIFGLTSFIKFITTGITLVQQRNQLSIKIIVPTLIYLTSFSIIYIDPEGISSHPFERETIYRGCYEGTQNTGVILFMESGEFEYLHGGIFGITTYENGTWKQHGDTLFIKYTNNVVHEGVGEKLLMTGDRFIKVQADTLQDNRRGFYKGYCKGEN